MEPTSWDCGNGYHEVNGIDPEYVDGIAYCPSCAEDQRQFADPRLEVTDVQAEWLAAEHEWQREKVMGAFADALLNTPNAGAGEMPLVVPGPVLERMAERAISTGVRHGMDWVAEGVGPAVLPQWQRQGLDQHRESAADPVAPWDGAIPEEVAVARSMTDLMAEFEAAELNVKSDRKAKGGKV